MKLMRTRVLRCVTVAASVALLGVLVVPTVWAGHVVLTDCAPPVCTTKNTRTLIHAPGDTVTIRGPLAPVSGARSLKIVALVVIVDGPGGGSLSSSGRGIAVDVIATGAVLVRGPIETSHPKGRVRIRAGNVLQVRGPGEIRSEAKVDLRCTARSCQVSFVDTLIRGRTVSVSSKGDLFTEGATFDAFGGGRSLRVKARGAVRDSGAPRLTVTSLGLSIDDSESLGGDVRAALDLCPWCPEPTSTVSIQSTTTPIVFSPTPAITPSLPPSGTPTATTAGTPTATTAGTPTATTAGTPTATTAGTPTATVSAVPTVSPLGTPTLTSGGTATPTPVGTPASTATVPMTATPTQTATPPDLRTATPTPAATPTPLSTGVSSSSPTIPVPTPTVPVHFMCYELRREPPPPAIEDFPLEDQFGPSLVKARRRWRICNPTSKNGESPNAPFADDHYVGYLIKQTEPRIERLKDIAVVNQFGSISVDLRKPKEMLVPSAKELASGGNPPPPSADPAVDHMKCWDVKGARTRGSVTSKDQFGDLLVEVKKPVRLCAPASANGTLVSDLETHLMCYRVKTSPRKLLAGSELFLANQFEEVRVVLSGPREICVPSRVTR